MEAVKTAIRRTLAGGRKSPARFSGDKPKRSLSDYLPAGSVYFYGYPAGTDSDFLLRVPPKIEELVAARALSCAGPNVSVVTFAATQAPALNQRLIDSFNIPKLPAERTIILPETITSSVNGIDRDRSIMAAIRGLVTPGRLVMAQPYSDEAMSTFYQIRPTIIRWLNDKMNMSHYIPSELLPKRLAAFKDGAELADNISSLHAPCVIKVSSSSSGDGVYICLSPEDIHAAISRLRDLKASIFIEEYIESHKNYGLHFGIPADPSKPIDVIGANEQLTTSTGAFIGGLITSTRMPDELKEASKTLKNQILPVVRALGWHGVGCFDVIVGTDGQSHFIDCNFRMTGMSAYHFLLSHGRLKAPLLGFSGEFKGSQAEFEAAMSGPAGAGSARKYVHLLALSHSDEAWNFNGALTYATEFELKQRAYELLAAGITSDALSAILNPVET